MERNSCSCSCDYDGPYPEFFDVKNIKAKKSHKCCECGCEIKPGEIYEKVVGKWDGNFNEFKTCLICSRIRDDYASRCPFGDLREVLRDCLGFDYITNEKVYGHEEEI